MRRTLNKIVIFSSLVFLVYGVYASATVNSGSVKHKGATAIYSIAMNVYNSLAIGNSITNAQISGTERGYTSVEFKLSHNPSLQSSYSKNYYLNASSSFSIQVNPSWIGGVISSGTSGGFTGGNGSVAFTVHP